MTLFYVPIEPYKNRYSEQWIRWFKGYFDEIGIDYKIIFGKSLSTEIMPASVFNPVSISYYRACQLEVIHKLVFKGVIKENDKLFFDDGQFPGVEQIAHYLPQIGLNVDLYGFFHAGTWDKYDYVNRFKISDWMQREEDAWFRIYKKIFVATDFHRNLILENKGYIEGIDRKIICTGEPFNSKEILKGRNIKKYSNRKIDCVFPHRIDEEKNPQDFLRLIQLAKIKNFKIPILFGMDKQDYYKLLCDSKIVVSTALQETFGIAVAEAVVLGCIPLLPDRLAYRDIYPREYLYKDLREAVLKVQKFLQMDDVEWRRRYASLLDIIRKFDDSVANIVLEIYDI